MIQDKFRFEVESDVKRLSYVRKQIDRFATRNSLPPSIAFRVKLAISELVTNIILHGYPDNVGGCIVIGLNLDSSILRVEIHDDAKVFDPRNVDSLELGTSLDDLPSSGMGIHLVNKVVDQLGYRRGNGHNQVIATFKLQPS